MTQMSIVTEFLGSGNFTVRNTAQGGVYESWAYTAPLHWHRAYSAPTPTGEALNPPTAAVAIPQHLFTGFSEGYWVHRVFLDGHLVGTYTFVDQQFAVPVLHDYIQSVAMPFSPSDVAGARGDDPCVPAPGGAVALLCAALFTRFRARKA
jgi:hypothetical protein